MKRSIRRGIAILMAALTIFFAGQPTMNAYAATTMKTTTAVYMREQGKPSAKIIMTVPAGKEVTILQISSSSNWYKVKYSGKTGYIYKSYLKDKTNTKVLKTAVNLRSSMSTANSKNIIRVVPKGAKVTILATKSNNWYQVSWNGYKGYMKGGYFTDDTSKEETDPVVKEKRKVKTALNFRKSNSTSAKIICVIPKGKTVYEIQLVNGGWSKIEYNGKTGYVMRKYLD